MAPEALLFDLDGTLADTHRWSAEELAGTCTSTSADEIRRRITSGNPAVTVAEHLGVTRRRFESASRGALPRLPLYTGARYTLERLRESGVAIGLGTGQSPLVVGVILEVPVLGSCFRSVVSGGTRGIRAMPASCPAPAHTLRARRATQRPGLVRWRPSRRPNRGRGRRSPLRMGKFRLQ